MFKVTSSRAIPRHDVRSVGPASNQQEFKEKEKTLLLCTETSARGITPTRRGTGESFKMFGVQHPPRDLHEAAAGAGIVITFF